MEVPTHKPLSTLLLLHTHAPARLQAARSITTVSLCGVHSRSACRRRAHLTAASYSEPRLQRRQSTSSTSFAGTAGKTPHVLVPVFRSTTQCRFHLLTRAPAKQRHQRQSPVTPGSPRRFDPASYWSCFWLRRRPIGLPALRAFRGLARPAPPSPNFSLKCIKSCRSEPVLYREHA